MEIGPYRLKDERTLEYNDGSWNEFANVLFVDNPVGTGYSYVDTDPKNYVRELDEMADQFMIFLEKWFALFPEYQRDDVSLIPQTPFSRTMLTVWLSSTLPESRMPASTSPISPSTFSRATKTWVHRISGI